MVSAIDQQGAQYKAVVLGRAHGIASDNSHRMHLLIGIPLVIATAVAGTSAFGNFPIVTAIASIVATLLAAVQTFLNPAERAAKHAAAALSLGTLSAKADATPEAIETVLSSVPRVSLSLQKKAQAAVDAEIELDRASSRQKRNLAGSRMFQG